MFLSGSLDGLNFTGGEQADVNDVIQRLKNGESVPIISSNGRVVMMGVPKQPKGMRYVKKTGLRTDGYFLVSEDNHLWRKHGMRYKSDDTVYVRCAFGRLNRDMKDEGIKICKGNSLMKKIKFSLK